MGQARNLTESTHTHLNHQGSLSLPAPSTVSGTPTSLLLLPSLAWIGPRVRAARISSRVVVSRRNGYGHQRTRQLRRCSRASCW